MKIEHFYDSETNTLTYLVFDEITKDALVIDPVLDFDPASGIIEDRSVKRVIDFVQENHLKVHYLMETHAHADHLSSSQILKQVFPTSQLVIGSRIKVVQSVFQSIFNLDEDFVADASQFDLTLNDYQEIAAGSLKIKAIPTPGHTPACMSYLIGDAVFTGDALFMPDSGTGRCDFPKGSAKELYHSIHDNLYSLPDETKVYVGHDYQPGGRELKFQTTIGESKKLNIQLKQETSENEFVQFRENRDKGLKAPKLLLPSIQININAGRLPKRENNGISYLKLPLNPKVTSGTL